MIAIPVVDCTFSSFSIILKLFSISSNAFFLIKSVKHITRNLFSLISIVDQVCNTRINKKLIIEFYNDFLSFSMMYMIKGFPFLKTILVTLMMLKIELFTSCYLISSEKADQSWFDSLPNSWKRRQNEHNIRFFFYMRSKFTNESLSLLFSEFIKSCVS